MKQTSILSPTRQLLEEEKSLVWQKPPSHIESEAEKRIYQEVVRNWNRGEMKISTILLEKMALHSIMSSINPIQTNFKKRNFVNS